MMMSRKASSIKGRYAKGYVTEEQLGRYLDLGVITDEEYKNILTSKPIVEEKEEIAEEGRG